MKHIIGLDIGTNSIGWVLLENNKIIDRGVIIFPIGTNVDKNGIESTKNMERRGYRGANRILARYKLRRKNLRKLLESIGMLPDFKGLNKIKGTYQSQELYELRALAIDQKIPEPEIGRILLLINKHRGFKSTSKSLSKTDDENGTVSAGITQLQTFMEASNSRTIGEYFFKMHIKAKDLFDQGLWHNINEPYDERALNNNGEFVYYNSRGIRKENGRYVGRDMYESEFDLIWRKQKEFYPQLTGSKKEYEEILKLPVPEKIIKLKQFKETMYWQIKHATIFYQRPLKSQKKYIGKCQFEPNRQTSPISSLLYQEFRIWKQISDLRYSDKMGEIFKQPLSKDSKEKVFDFLQINLKLNLKEGKKREDGTRNIDIMDVLGISNKKNYEFILNNDDEESYLHGNKTLSSIRTSCGENKFRLLLSEDKLDKLWHILYMAQDDIWLKDTLFWKWKFENEEEINNLIRMGLEEGFGSYSSKVLKKILPYMKAGKDEYDSLVLANYLKSPDEYKEERILADKIKQLSNNELRNPVVEKAVSQSIKLVNSLLKKHKDLINKKELVIRIESTRELKKPKKQREDMRRNNNETDKKREEYAKFLNQQIKNGKLNFAREIYKYDSIIYKFELWLELGADKEDPAFKEFEKIVQRKDKEKHALWLECNRICPYSGKVISLSKLFSPNNEIEIEHIIPYSRSLDDSFTNKTVTFNHVNKLKGSKTAFEFISEQGNESLRNYKERIKVFKKGNSVAKYEKLLLENVGSEFTNAQISNTSYIAKYVRKKMQEVCFDVQFTNGAATAELRKNDWKLNNLLDKIRYEEETGIEIDPYLREFSMYKRSFKSYLETKAKSKDLQPIIWKSLTRENTAEYEAETKNPIFEWWQHIQKFDSFRGAKGKKDRSDHRHHLLDAIIISACSPSVIKELSTLSRQREESGIYAYDSKGNLTRELIDCPLKYNDVKNALKNVLVYHKSEKRLVSSKTNKIKIKGQLPIIQKTFSPRGSLHKDNFYGKLKNPSLQGFDKADVYIKRDVLNGEKFKDFSSLEKVVDDKLKAILRKRLEMFDGKGEKAFSEENLTKNPLHLYSFDIYPDEAPNLPLSKKGNLLPIIKKVRVINKNSRNLIQLKAKENGVTINENRYVETDGNYLMALYESKEIDKKGKVKIKRDFEILSFYKAVQKKRNGEKLFSDEKLFKDGTFIPLNKKCPFIKAGDLVVLFENEDSIIDWNDNSFLNRNLYKVTEIGLDYRSESEQYGTIKFAKHNVMKTSKDSYEKAGFFVKKLHTGLNIMKVKLNNLGQIMVFEG